MGVFVGPRLFQDAPLLLSESVTSVACTYHSSNKDPPPTKVFASSEFKEGTEENREEAKAKTGKWVGVILGCSVCTVSEAQWGCLANQTLISSFSWLTWYNWEEGTKTTMMLKEKAKKKKTVCGFIDWSQQEDSMGCPFWHRDIAQQLSAKIVLHHGPHTPHLRSKWHQWISPFCQCIKQFNYTYNPCES